MRFIALLAACAALAMPELVRAGDPTPYPDFTFKMGKPPKQGTRKFITVRIEPKPEQPRKSKKNQESSETPAEIGSYAWFWEKVSPGLSDNVTGRMRQAFDNLDSGPGGARVAGPRLRTVQAIARSEGQRILRATVGSEVSPALVLAVIAVESGGRTTVVSNKGAQGLMQLMPDTATRFGVSDSLDADQNIRGGVAYLDWLLKEFGGDVVLALAGYNAGENAVKKHDGVPPYAETRDYVPKVLAAFQVARALCKTQPELVTDACALNLASN